MSNLYRTWCNRNNMIINYNIAQDLKELGFNRKCGLAYIYVRTTGVIKYPMTNTNKDYIEEFTTNGWHRYKFMCSAPHIYKVCKWLREEHNYYVLPTFNNKNLTCEIWKKSNTNSEKVFSEEGFVSYEECLISGIKRALDIIRNEYK